MLQGKIFNSKKNNSINEILNKCVSSSYSFYSENKEEQSIKVSKNINEIRSKLIEEPQLIKSGKILNNPLLKYEIVKEQYTNSYIMKFSKILILHVNEQDYTNFLRKYIDNTSYLFYIYKSERLYHIFCVSHLKSEINESYLKFCFNSYFDKPNLILASMFYSFLILNENFKEFYKRMYGEGCPDKNKLKFIRKVGLGKNHYPIVNSVAQFYNSYITNTFLPINYLYLH